MSKWLRYNVAKADDMYVSIKTQCMEGLSSEASSFSFDDVADSLNLKAWKDTIRWDYVARMLEEDEGADLIPVNKVFFKKRKTGADKVANNQIAGPHGKCVGYANLCPLTEELYLAKLRLHQNQKAGMQKVVDKLGDEGANKGIDTGKIQEITGKAHQPRIEDQSDDEDAA